MAMSSSEESEPEDEPALPDLPYYEPEDGSLSVANPRKSSLAPKLDSVYSLPWNAKGKGCGPVGAWQSAAAELSSDDESVDIVALGSALQMSKGPERWVFSIVTQVLEPDGKQGPGVKKAPPPVCRFCFWLVEHSCQYYTTAHDTQHESRTSAARSVVLREVLSAREVLLVEELRAQPLQLVLRVLLRIEAARHLPH